MSKAALDDDSSDDEVNVTLDGDKKKRPGKRKVSSSKTPHPSFFENEDYSKPIVPELNMMLGTPESPVNIAGTYFHPCETLEKYFIADIIALPTPNLMIRDAVYIY